MPPPPKPTNGFAKAALYCGIFGLLIGILAILAIIFGAIGISNAKKRGGVGMGVAITGLTLGIMVVTGVLIAVVLGIFRS